MLKNARVTSEDAAAIATQNGVAHGGGVVIVTVVEADVAIIGVVRY